LTNFNTCIFIYEFKNIKSDIIIFLKIEDFSKRCQEYLEKIKWPKEVGMAYD
jgi:hypothetical protein